MKLKELEKNHGEVMIRMALSYMFDKGMEFCNNITDENIAALEANAIMSKEFVQEFVKAAREISSYSLWNDILPYIKEEIVISGFEDYKKKSERFTTIAYNAITLGQLDEQYASKEDLCCDLGCDEEEFDEIMEGMSAFDMEAQKHMLQMYRKDRQ